MECTSCGKSYDGDDMFTLGWLRRHNEVVAEGFVGWPSDRKMQCGTICPHCGHANDAPGYSPGDEIPQQDTDGTWHCASRYIPPRLIKSIGEAIMTTYMTPEEIVKGGK